MRSLVLLLALSLCAPAFVHAQQPTYSSLRAEAERFFAEGSYARAREVYLQAQPLVPTPVEARWVDFRLADTLWRSAAATASSDETKLEEAREKLEAIAAAPKRVEDRDRVWAESSESLGDFWWTRRGARNISTAWPHYSGALDWWAGARDVALARDRYAAIVTKAAAPPGREPWETYGYHGVAIPLGTLESFLKIARDEHERAFAHYLIAMTAQRTGDWNQLERVPGEFEAALRAGRSAAWYDDALFQYAAFLASSGRVVFLENGQWQREVDPVAALALYRRLTTEFAKGETQYFDSAVEEIRKLTSPGVAVTISSVFQPGAVVEYALSWRNVPRVDLALYRVDLTTAVAPDARNGYADLVSSLTTTGLQPLASWTKDTSATKPHQPGAERLEYPTPLAPGAYVLEARAGDATARDLVLVSDAALVVKSSDRDALLYFCDAISGAPVPGARVALWAWSRPSSGGDPVWRKLDGTTGSDGVARVELPRDGHSGQLLAAAAAGERQAFAVTQRYGYSSPDPWRIYVTTDRPAYRPGEKAHWKLTARQQSEAGYTTPASRVVEYRIDDPRDAKVAEGKATLNGFGSAWGELELAASMPLGEYTITFWEEGRGRTIGSATIFRLEEYKLPEFTVRVKTPEENGAKKAFRLGERVSADIEAEYYFGGPVAGATVEAVIYQRPFYRFPVVRRELPWLYGEDRTPSWYGRGQVVKRETLTTDAEGRARITFDTPRAANQDFEYTIEARVTDASRREIFGTELVRVTRQRYYVDLRPDRKLLRPSDETRVEISARDANDRPVAVEGTVTVTREWWREVWIDPKGREVSGDALRRAREQMKVFPPSVCDGERPWQLKSRDYEREEVLRQTVTTGTDGEARLAFTPAREGYYRVSWASRDRVGPPIQAAATVWALTNQTTELGYRSGELEVLVDSDTARVGETAKVMLASSAEGRWALFTVEAEGVLKYELVRLDGTVKLVELPVEERFAPNVYLNAASVSAGQLHTAREELVVPPSRNFLTVDVRADREVYEPREEGTLTVTARDADGRPVAAEVGLGFVDESVYYIQQDYAEDPRKVFFGQRRDQRVTTQSTFQAKSFARQVEREDKSDDQPRDELSLDGRNAVGASEAVTVSGPPPPPALMRVAPGVVAGETKEEFAVVTRPDGQPATGQEPAVQVRSDFRSTILWQPDVVTGPDGTAVVKVTFPDSLTGWRATARAATAVSQFGVATASARTRKPLTVRLQTPRFFVAGDTATVSAIVNNNTDAPLDVAPRLAAEGLEISGDATSRTIAAGGEARFDWTATIREPGAAKLAVTARGGSHGDAMERSVPVFEHGIEKLQTLSGKTRSAETTVTLDLPSARKAGSTSLEVQIAPSLAATMLDALPYLIEYPYGCTEQTMSRFLPAVVVSKTLADQGIAPETIAGRLSELDAVRKAGLARLYDFQHDDGGWGWWKEGESDHWMTAYVVWGLTLARGAGVEVDDEVLQTGAGYLSTEIVEEEQSLDVQAWMLHALAEYRAARKEAAGAHEETALANLLAKRDGLNAYSKALVAIAAHDLGRTEDARALARNLENGAKIDRAPGSSRAARASGGATLATAHWGEETGWWRWSEGSVETTAFVLRALATIDAKGPLVEPAMNWLVKNRRGAQWSNTRDTALAVLALNEYLRTSGELASDVEYELFVNGRSIATRRVTRDEAIAKPSRFTIDPGAVGDRNEIRIVRRGEGALYYSAEARYFSLEEPVTATGNEIFARRQYFKLVPRTTLLKGIAYDRVPLGDGEAVRSGERIETVLTVEAKNDYEYLVFEDLKPAGYEAVEIRSGGPAFVRELTSAAVDGERRGDPADYTGRDRWVHQELRDRKVALFVDKLPQGVWEIRYELRAETPGEFHALPVLGHAMYVPEIRCNGAETRVRVVDHQNRSR